MVTLYIPAVLRRLTGGRDRLRIAASGTLGAVLAEADRDHPGLLDALVAGDGVRPALAVAINGEMCSGALFEVVEDGAEIHVVPALGGGRGRMD